RDYVCSRVLQPSEAVVRLGLLASSWPLNDSTVSTIVNRNEYDVEGPQMEVPAVPAMHYFDLYGGSELQIRKYLGGKSVLSFAIESNGFGAVLATNSERDAKMQKLMSAMKQMTVKPLASFSSQHEVLKQKIVPIAATTTGSSAPASMIQIHEGDFLFRVSGVEIEGSNDIGVDVQYPWQDATRRFHEHPMHIKSFYIDKYPVTNVEFKQFLD